MKVPAVAFKASSTPMTFLPRFEKYWTSQPWDAPTTLRMSGAPMLRREGAPRQPARTSADNMHSSEPAAKMGRSRPSLPSHSYGQKPSIGSWSSKAVGGAPRAGPGCHVMGVHPAETSRATWSARRPWTFARFHILLNAANSAPDRLRFKPNISPRVLSGPRSAIICLSFL